MADIMDENPGETLNVGLADAAATTADALSVVQLGKIVPLPSGPLVILENVSFTIAAGDSVADVGASGSGKSPLPSLLAWLGPPTPRLLVPSPCGRCSPTTRT